MNGQAANEWFHESELVCPRCGQTMELGYLNAGKGPFRWVQEDVPSSVELRWRPDDHQATFTVSS
jgi:hypothetical protein